jgi:hypothetical protein
MIVIRIRRIKIYVLVMKRATFPGAVSVMYFKDHNCSKIVWLEYLMFKKSPVLFRYEKLFVFDVLENSV